MKAIFSTVFIMLTLRAFTQTPAQAGILRLSNKIFTWEVENKADSLDNVLDEKFTAFTSSGDKQVKEKYLAALRSGSIVHNNIIVDDSSAIIVNNTATVAGKGRFTVTIGGNKRMIHLSYLEVFIRNNGQSPWRMLALHAGLLNN